MEPVALPVGTLTLTSFRFYLAEVSLLAGSQAIPADLVAASDLVITKSGGLIVSEVLARGTPMLIVDPIPGQEECNADYLLEHGCAVKARTLDVLDYKVLELLENPARLDMMRRACSAISRAGAGREVLRHVLDENSARG